MAQLKSHEVDSWFRRPETGRFAVFLVYGPDRGLVAERAAHLASIVGAAPGDPFATVRLEAADLDHDAGRLVDEARTISLFGGRRLIWVRRAGAQNALADAIRVLVDEPPSDAIVIVEADELRKSAALRTIVENADRALALPCYADEARALDQLIDETLARSGLTMGRDARAALRARLGGDRLASRSELEKLALYCAGRSSIEVHDIEALSGDVSQLTVDTALDALFEGRPRAFDEAMGRLAATGGSMQTVLLAVERLLQRFHLMRSGMHATGASVAASIAAARPSLFGARRRQAERLLAALDVGAFDEAGSKVSRLVLESRQNTRLSDVLIRRNLLALSMDFGRKLGCDG